MSPLRVPIDELLRTPELRPYAALAGLALAQGRLTHHDLCLFWKWQRWRKEARRQRLATLEDVEAFLTGKCSNGCHHMLVSCLRQLDPASPDLPALEQAQLMHSRRARPAFQRRPRRPRPRRVSLPEAALPQTWQDVLRRMRGGQSGVAGHKAPAMPIIESIGQKLGQLALAAQAAGLPATVEQPQVAAWLETMFARDLALRTVVSSLCRLRVFLQHTGWDPALEQLVKAEIRQLKDETVGLPKKKERFLERTGLSLLDVVAAAAAALEDARTAIHPTIRQEHYNAAALYALALVAAPRLADIQRLIVGQTIHRDERGWRLQLDTQKTRQRQTQRVDQRLTAYIDAAILHGVDEDFLGERYAVRLGTPLFVRNALNEPHCYAWATHVFRKRFGIGLHIMRSLWHDHGRTRGAAGVEEALAVCGHASAEARLHYQTEHGRQALAKRAVSLLNTLGDDDHL